MDARSHHPPLTSKTTEKTLTFSSPCVSLPLRLLKIDATSHLHRVVAVAVAVAAFLAAGAEASGIGFDLHHRFSPVVRQWAEARGHAFWPEAGVEGSPEYYSALARHDRALRARRGLADGDGLLTFADGNVTFRLDGSLHYAEVAVGTPSATYLVALDTGSDLFWVPCDCKQCAPIDNSTTGRGGAVLRPYSPRQSSTSKAVTCTHALCGRPDACAAAGATGSSSSCPYTVRYVSANTSSAGVLVEDVLYFTRENKDGANAAVEAAVVFGCGQVQTGAFLDGPGTDGLLGLGMTRVSVPSVLASKGLVASDSFSMCFSPDGVGRINFGDSGSRGQAETPFIVGDTLTHPTYNISVTGINVEGKALPVEFAAVVDSGTSFTYLNEPAYSQLATNFNSQVRERRTNFSASIPFEYCYALSRNQSRRVRIPAVSLTTKGGAVFPVAEPYVVVAGETSDGRVVVLGYCLAIIKNDIAVDFIGQNFMTGLKVVFDRERSVLGWDKFDCYKGVKAEDADVSPGAAPPGPTPTTLKPPPQSDAANREYPGAPPVPRQDGPAAAGTGRSHASSRALGGLSFFSLILLPLLAAAAAVV